MLVLLPVEVSTHYLEVLTNLVVETFHFKSGEDAPPLLKVITDPLTKQIIQVTWLPPERKSARSFPFALHSAQPGRDRGLSTAIWLPPKKAKESGTEGTPNRVMGLFCFLDSNMHVMLGNAGRW